MSTPTTPPNIGTVITNATARRVIYGVYVLLAFVAACVQVAYASTNTANPSWLTVTLAVVAFAAVPVTGLAVANTSTPGQTQAIADAVVQAIPVATLTSSDPTSVPTPADPSQPAAGTQPAALDAGDYVPTTPPSTDSSTPASS